MESENQEEVMTGKIMENMVKLGHPGIPEKGTYRVSELPYCLRKAYFFRVKEVTQTINGLMFTGTLLHKAIPELMEGVVDAKNSKFEVKCVYSDNGIKIVGHADVITRNCVWEWKFTGNRAESMSGLPASYFSQANAYAVMSKKPKYRLVLVNRYDLKVDIIEGKTNDYSFDIMVERARNLHESIKKGIVPEGPEFGFECKKCIFRNICYEDGDIKKPIETEKIQKSEDAKSFM
jgi:CRISPR/Cas system-associated exonuclease Cas4 (RecB family)